jgi:Ankyrin repeats (3 copies)
MHLAVARLDVKAVVKLMMKSAEVNFKDTFTGDTPLHLLVNVYMKNAIAAKKILGFLIDSGADPNIKNNEGWTPLHLAVKKSSLDVVEALISVRHSL